MSKPLLERALNMKAKDGADVAARWLEKQGISRELGLIAMVGGKPANERYGVDVWRWGKRGRS